MGLLQEIRLMDGTNKTVEPKKHEMYRPLFLSVINKKGHFLIEKSSLEYEMTACLFKSGKNFYEWLKENNLNIEETKNYFKIYV